MKGIILVFCSLCFSLIIFSQKNDSKPDVPLFSDTKTIDFIHIINSNPNDTFSINAGDKLGTVAPFPDTLSKLYENEIKISIKLYKQQQFFDAKSILEIPIIKEPNNLFILNYYARASYNVDSEQSYRAYKRLVTKLDSLYNNSIDSIKIDLWFREAYWKLGTLYMDQKIWGKAYFEISRFIISAQDAKGSFIYCQALQYLTECAYMLKDDKLTKYLAERTLFYDPKNLYVRGLLKKIK